MGYLQVTDDAYPVLKLTAKSEAVLKGLQKVELIASQTMEEQQPAAALPFEAGLLTELKNIRRDIALHENVPAYIILSDATLHGNGHLLAANPGRVAPDIRLWRC